MGKLLYMEKKKRRLFVLLEGNGRKELRKEEKERGVNEMRRWRLGTTRNELSGLTTKQI